LQAHENCSNHGSAERDRSHCELSSSQPKARLLPAYCTVLQRAPRTCIRIRKSLESWSPYPPKDSFCCTHKLRITLAKLSAEGTSAGNKSLSVKFTKVANGEP